MYNRHINTKGCTTDIIKTKGCTIDSCTTDIIKNVVQQTALKQKVVKHTS